MSVLLQPRRLVAPSDLLVVYEDYATVTTLRVTPGQTFRSRYGAFPHSSMVGKPFGARLASPSGKGFVFLLPPTPELWTASLQHRTQILYIADISMICLQLELLPGCRVIEAGTGSGALSHSLARCVGERGHLFTYEFNEKRAAAAAKEFEANGLASRVSCRHGDACVRGSTYEGIAPQSIDAVIFDLPQPWDAVVIAAPLVKPGGRLCCFSPCIEQVARTLEVLPSVGFTKAETIEVITRTHDVRESHAGRDALAAIVASVSPAALPTPDVGPEERDVAEAEGEVAEAGETAATSGSLGADGEGKPAGKRLRVEKGDWRPVASSGAPALVTKPYDDMRGHTGFLLFATKHVD
ncbi:hypothetical protein AB1Y20_008956 [Prymnesium parvum]|uniref:tRNA (adenine(58)-N(1))-methyltransferase n=1 Tax=Prymnesium parvum TaxID=97485 RepID=A0AB34K3H1_PRYPA